jgi:hypothetical protein
MNVDRQPPAADYTAANVKLNLPTNYYGLYHDEFEEFLRQEQGRRSIHLSPNSLYHVFAAGVEVGKRVK